MFHRRLVPGRRERTSYDLFAANGIPIPTYGWHTLTLNLGLRRDFTWHFVVADVQIPIIGVDLLANFSLLVDCRNNRILDGVTSLSAPAQTASTRFPERKNHWEQHTNGRPIRRFPRLTRPSGVQRTVRHNTEPTQRDPPQCAVLHRTPPAHHQQEYPPRLSGQQAMQGRPAHLQPRRISRLSGQQVAKANSLTCGLAGPLRNAGQPAAQDTHSPAATPNHCASSPTDYPSTQMPVAGRQRNTAPDLRPPPHGIGTTPSSTSPVDNAARTAAKTTSHADQPFRPTRPSPARYNL